MRTRFHAEPMVQATELLLQERTPRDVAVAHPRAEEVGASAAVARPRARGRAPPAQPARRQPVGPPAVERPLLGDADGGRLGLQPLGRPRRHALARGPDPRRLGQLHLPARRRERRGLVGDLPAARHRARQLRRHVRRGPRRVRPPRRHAHHDARRRRLARGRRRGPPRLAHQHRARRRARSRSPPMPRSCWRRRAADAAHPAFSKLFVQTEYLADCRRARWRRAAAAAPAKPELWAAHLAVVEGETVGERRVRDRPRPLPRPRQRHRRAGRRDRRPAPVQHRRAGARSDLRLRRRLRDPGRRHGARSPSGPWSAASREALLDARRQAPATPTPSSAPRRSPGRRRRCSSATSASRPTRPASSSASPDTSSTPIRRCARRRTRSAAASRRRRRCGRTASPATCRSCWSASTRSRTSGIVRQLLRAHEYWRLKGLAVDLVILNERGASYVQDLQVTLETLVRTSRSRTHSAPRASRAASSCCAAT